MALMKWFSGTVRWLCSHSLRTIRPPTVLKVHSKLFFTVNLQFLKIWWNFREKKMVNSSTTNLDLRYGLIWIIIYCVKHSLLPWRVAGILNRIVYQCHNVGYTAHKSKIHIRYNSNPYHIRNILSMEITYDRTKKVERGFAIEMNFTISNPVAFRWIGG